MIAWERSRAASTYGIIWGDAVKTNMEELSAECDCSDDSKILTEVDSNKIKVIETRKSESTYLREEDVPGAILPPRKYRWKVFSAELFTSGPVSRANACAVGL